MDNTCKQLWTQTLDNLENAQYFDPDTMGWLKKSTLFKIDETQAFVSYQSSITCSLLKKHLQLLEDELAEQWGSSVKIMLTTKKEAEAMMPGEVIRQRTSSLIDCSFDAAYTFETFVGGPSNQEALAACKAVCAGRNRKMLNPLLIYGNSGLGKTHLLTAIGNEIRSKHPEKKVIYLYSGKLVTLLLDAMRTKNTSFNAVERVKEQLLDCDYFLIDDIQNLRSESCQEVFFTIYNDLIAQNKQIILTSDTHPTHMASITKRLISRFTSGLTVCISKPGMETAKAIVKKKIEGHEEAFDVDEDVLDFLAMSFSEDIRALEGTLNRLIFNAALFNPEKITMPFAMGVLKNEPVITSSEELDAKAVKKAVIRYYSLSYKDLEGKSRQKKIATARQICIYLMREMLEIPFSQIGTELGGRDHTTISSAYNKAVKLSKENAEYAQAIGEIRKKISV